MKLRSAIAIGALAVLPWAVHAEGLPYNYVEARYVNVDVDDTDVDFDGFVGEVSAKIADPIYLFGSFGMSESDEVNGVSLESTGFGAGAGWILPMAAGTDLNLEAAFLWAEAEVNGGPFDGASDDDNGFGLRGGIRHMFTQQLEVDAGVNYTDFGDDGETGFDVGALYSFTPAFAAAASFEFGDDAKAWTVGGRFYF